MEYMVLGYLIVWACSFVFIFSMVQRQRGLQREIESLKDVLRDEKARGNS